MAHAALVESATQTFDLVREENVGSCALTLAAVESTQSGKVADVSHFLQHRIR